MRNLPCDLVTVKSGDDLSFIHEKPNWDPNSLTAYYLHQKELERFIRQCLGFGLKVQLPVFPPDAAGDSGIDVVVNELIFDLKTFGLYEATKTKTMDSEYWEGRTPLRWLLTDFLVFVPLGSAPEVWEVGPYRHLRESYNPKYAPFFYKEYVMSFPNFASAV
jgi:hypothetical protein